MGKRQNIVCKSETFYHFHTKLSPSPSPPPPPPHLPWQQGLVMADYETGNQRNQRIGYKMRGQWNQWIISR